MHWIYGISDIYNMVQSNSKITVIMQQQSNFIIGGHCNMWYWAVREPLLYKLHRKVYILSRFGIVAIGYGLDKESACADQWSLKNQLIITSDWHHWRETFSTSWGLDMLSSCGWERVGINTIYLKYLDNRKILLQDWHIKLFSKGTNYISNWQLNLALCTWLWW